MSKKILILGWARHGKDTVADFMQQRHGLDLRSSSWFLADRCVRPYLAERGVNYDSLFDCYEDRVNHRAAWHDAIVAYNEDPTRLTREILAVSDGYIGMRADREFQASKHLFDQIFWVDASDRGLPPEPKSSMDIEFDPAEMVFINNSGPLEELGDRVDAALREPAW